MIFIPPTTLTIYSARFTLARTQHPRTNNQYLVLKFDLSSINVSSSFIEMKESFNKVVNNDLENFIKEYNKGLDYPTVNDVIDSSKRDCH